MSVSLCCLQSVGKGELLHLPDFLECTLQCFLSCGEYIGDGEDIGDCCHISMNDDVYTYRGLCSVLIQINGTGSWDGAITAWTFEISLPPVH